QMRGNLHRPLLVEHGKLGEHAVERAAELIDDVPVHPAVAPAREIATGHAIADPEACDRIADGHNFPRTVAEGNHSLLRGQRIGARENERVSLVERRRVDSDHDFRRAGLRILSRTHDDTVDASDLVEVIGTHAGTIAITRTAVDYVEVMAHDEAIGEHR